MRRHFTCLMLLGFGLWTVTTLAVQQRTARDGIFSEAQRTRGDEAYRAACAACHGAQLEGGGMAPALTGEEFATKWKNRTVGVLFERIRVTMPAENPGSLTAPQTADLVAFLLGANGSPAGASDLSDDVETLKQIRLEPAE